MQLIVQKNEEFLQQNESVLQNDFMKLREERDTLEADLLEAREVLERLKAEHEEEIKEKNELLAYEYASRKSVKEGINFV